MSDEGGRWNSNTPLPKLHNGEKCPARLDGVRCGGELCLTKLKGCPYRVINGMEKYAAAKAIRRLIEEKKIGV